LPVESAPILYPGPGSTTVLTTYSGEHPDPTQTCGWQGQTVGLPLIVMQPTPPSRHLRAILKGPTGTETSTNRSLCVVDSNTYRSTDRLYGPTGKQILEATNAVFLIPREPLTTGSYSVSVLQRGVPEITWTFKVKAPVTGLGH
ncbi:MAG TPA: hypothetical protein VME01_09660, partial [Solirubrobacteraceae bacterium]|nr:hypothetical protein [Solirubrobacteraceae bacterium]